MPTPQLRERIRRRLADETGRIAKQAPFTVGLCYPSPYRVGMSSLGYQRIYRALMEAPGLACERVFLDDECEKDAARKPEPPVTYESLRTIDELPVLAFSVAYELEIAGLVRILQAAGIPPLRRDRGEHHPLVVAGGPLTFSNPRPLAALVDAIVVGEADARTVDVMRAIEAAPTRDAQLAALAAVPHVFVPAHHAVLPPVGAEDDATLPAHSAIRTPHTELASMFLVETSRGCSRGCTYCVMRRSTNGGMRIVPAETILATIPEGERRVGLVGAAVSDHPRIVDIVNTLADRGCEVGLSSLRPDKLARGEDFVAALARVGYRTLTTAMDGTSERVRETLDRRARPQHLLRCAELAKKHGMDRMKLYLMIGVPGETDADVDECVAFATELSRIVPLALGIAPFCAKRNTPLDRQPFAGIDVVDARLDRLRRGLKGRVDVRATSARWAWVEYVLAQGGDAEGEAVVAAVDAGGSFRAYERAFSRLEGAAPRRSLTLATA
ncbi:MAG TPA: radical SAM protein [Polyangiaceae bacterium]